MSMSISRGSPSSALVTTGSQSPTVSHGSGFNSAGIPSVTQGTDTQGSRNPTPTQGFFKQPATIAGTFTAVGVVVIAAAVGVIVLTRLRRRHPRGSHRVPDSDPDEEPQHDSGHMRHRSLQTNTHRSIASHASTLPSVEDIQVDTSFVTIQNPPISDYQALSTSETLAARSSWKMMPDSGTPTSPVDPVDPHGWPIVTSEIERDTQRLAVSSDLYSSDPDIRAAMGWILADEATLESIPEDDQDSASLFNKGYGTRPIRQLNDRPAFASQ